VTKVTRAREEVQVKLYEISTLALEGSGSLTALRKLRSRETLPLPTVEETRWAPGPVWKGMDKK
jgi:hypothetical protein